MDSADNYGGVLIGHRNRYNEADQKTLNRVYGDSARRISCEAALSMRAAAAITCGLSVNSSFPTEDSLDYRGTALCHYYEKPDTLKIGAEQIDARTWLSSPERALLDVACFSLSRRACEHILSAALFRRYDSETIIEIAEEAEMTCGVRKLAAVFSLIPNSRSSEWHKVIMRHGRALEEEPIPMWKTPKGCESYDENCELDADFGVIWNVPRKEVYESVFRLS